MSTLSSENVFTFGKLRVSVLGPSVVRIEEKAPHGFEDRTTFLVEDRTPRLAKVNVEEGESATRLVLDRHVLVIPRGAVSIREVAILDHNSRLVWRLQDSLPVRPSWPDPSNPGRCWAVADNPRMVPPAWGATPAPTDYQGPHADVSGWDLGNDAPDVYVFLHEGDLAAWRRQFLTLTGPIPMPPKWAFGYWNSLYYPYTEQEALDTIDEHRQRDYPLDVFVVDTDWRVGGSGGYEVEKKYFPDMPRFLKEAHARHAKVVFNDHPQPNDMKPLEPAMMKFRFGGLAKFLEDGIDAWWYDRNWFHIIDGPVWGIDKDIWGQRLYVDVATRVRPNKRPMIMSMRSDHPAGHRYPIWWTGDILTTYDALAEGVRDSVNDGLRLMPYVNQDLGGHMAQPDDEQYVRWLQYGCLSPVARVHGTRREGVTRYPWTFGERAASIIRDYVKLRYRLLPTIYAAARRAYEDGTPLLRKLILEWPTYAEAHASDQYLLGDDLLVAPICGAAGEGRSAGRTVWIPPGRWQDVWTGQVVEGPSNRHVQAPLEQMPLFVRVGGVLLLGPDMHHTGEKPWDPIVVDAYPEKGTITERSLYEDDGESNDYRNGAFRKTPVRIEQHHRRIRVSIDQPEGDFHGAIHRRTWRIRVHLPQGSEPTACRVDGSDHLFRCLSAPSPDGAALLGWGQPPRPLAGPIVEIEVASEQDVRTIDLDL